MSDHITFEYRASRAKRPWSVRVDAQLLFDARGKRRQFATQAQARKAATRFLSSPDSGDSR